MLQSCHSCPAFRASCTSCSSRLTELFNSASCSCNSSGRLECRLEWLCNLPNHLESTTVDVRPTTVDLYRESCTHDGCGPPPPNLASQLVSPLLTLETPATRSKGSDGSAFQQPFQFLLQVVRLIALKALGRCFCGLAQISWVTSPRIVCVSRPCAGHAR